VLIAAVAMTLLAPAPLAAQTGGTCVPIGERGTREFGCFITALIGAASYAAVYME
jgi:hypothetical protein